MADHQGAPGYFRRAAERECQAAALRNPMEQSDACGRLDTNRVARDHRGGDPLGQSRGGTLASAGMRGMASDLPISDAKADTRAGGLELERCIETAATALIECQQADGHWVFELEADATIPAEYVLFTHYLGESADAALEAKIAAYLQRIQGDHGGWPLFHGGQFDISASVKTY